MTKRSTAVLKHALMTALLSGCKPCRERRSASGVCRRFRLPSAARR